MGHSVSKAADNAVKKSEKTKTADRTPVQIVDDVRKNLSAGLAVTPDDQKFLLQKLDDAHMLMRQTSKQLQEATETIIELQGLNASQSTMIVEQQAKLEEFRAVYDTENRSQTLRVERVMEPGSPEAVAAEAVSGFEHTVGFARMSGAGSGE